VSLFPWYAFYLLFLLPFFDPRRPFRLLHLDLLVLLIVGTWPLKSATTGTEPPGWFTVVTVVGLLWLLGRLWWSGLRPRRRPEPLVPVLPTTWLAVVVVVLVCLRIGSIPVSPAYVSDVGLASVIGADLIGEGHGVYDGQIHRELWHGDTYGPVTYLAYVPFEQAIPWPGSIRHNFEQPKPAFAAAAAFDLLMVLGLFLLGRVLRRGSEGHTMGVALAYAWAAFPYALLTLRYSFNDAVVGLLTLWAVVALHYPLARGMLAALAGATKFAPLVLAPLLARGTGERPLRTVIPFAAAFVAVTLALYLPLMPDGGVPELYDRTLGYQEERAGWSRIWASLPALNWLQTACQVAVAVLALAVAFVPRRKTAFQVTSLAAALVIAAQLTGRNWSAAYVVWFAPLAFGGLLGAYDCADVPRPRRRRPATKLGTAG
jgi:Glycosyltransferase family 87